MLQIIPLESPVEITSVVKLLNIDKSSNWFRRLTIQKISIEYILTQRHIMYNTGIMNKHDSDHTDNVTGFQNI